MAKNIQSTRILRPKDVIRMTGLSRSTVYRLKDEKGSDFPRPVRLTEKTVGWREADIVAWIESRPFAANDE